MKLDQSFWSGRKVFITGHTGFKGSWLALWLQRLGADVFGYAFEPTNQDGLFNTASVGSGMSSVYGDIRQIDNLYAAISEFRPEIIFHMAAQALVRQSYVNPIETYSTNVMGTINLFEVVRRVDSVKALINVTSDKCYHNSNNSKSFQENDPMGGHDPYSNSKGCAELVTFAYRESFFQGIGKDKRNMALASVRAGNVIGGGDWSEDRLIPDAMRALKKNEEVLIRNPNSRRPWQHVLEPLSGYMVLAQGLLSEKNNLSSGWNFGPEESDSIPVSELMDKLVSATAERLRWRQWSEDSAPYEATNLRLDISKAKEILGWSPRWRIDQGLTATAAWYLAFLEKADMRKFSMGQIEDFMSAH